MMDRLRSIFYWLVRSVCRVAARIFYRRFEIVGLDRFPADGPLLAVGNHGNSLIDPMLLLGFLPRRFRFLAKSTFWNSAGWRVIMEMAGAIPVYRRHDPDSDTGRNAETFAASHRVLAQGGAIALFPEGLSHDEPSLQHLKTGAARIALEAEELYGPLAVRFVPVGLIFEEPHAFRSSVLMRIGDPFDLASEQSAYKVAPRQTVREATDKIDNALRTVTMNYRSWGEARLLDLAADIYARPRIELPTLQDLETRVRMRTAFLDRYQEIYASAPEALEDLRNLLEGYDQLLSLAGVGDEQVAASYPTKPVARFVLVEFALLALKLPVALIGIALNWLPYKIPGWVTRWSGQPRNLAATYKVIISLVLFPLVWAAEAWLGARLMPFPFAGLALLIGAPLTGWIALRFFERLARILSESRSFLLLHSRKSLTVELVEQRRRILSRLVELEPGRGLADQPEQSGQPA